MEQDTTNGQTPGQKETKTGNNSNPDNVAESKLQTFEQAMRPAIKWLAENCHPHAKIIIENDSAELVDGQMVFTTEEYIKD